MAYKWKSEKQRKWWFWYITHGEDRSQSPNYYSGSTGWIYRDDIVTSKKIKKLSPTRGLPFEEDFDNFDKWLEKQGWGTIKEQMERVDTWHWSVRWIAEPLTTVILSAILASLLFINAITFTAVEETAAHEAYWIYKPGVRQAAQGFYKNPSIRSQIITDNMYQELKLVKLGDINTYSSIVSKYQPYLINAEKIANEFMIALRGSNVVQKGLSLLPQII